MKQKRSVSKNTEINHDLAMLPLRGRNSAVAGLIWQPVHTVRNIQAEARALIKNEKCDFYLTHVRGNRAQCGMTRRLPQNSRSWSAILMLREALGDSWLGLFRLPDGRYWLAAVDNGMVVPGGDVIFTDEQEAIERYRSYIGLFPWERQYLSGVDGYEGESVDLLQLLSSSVLKSEYRIVYAQEMRRRVRFWITRGALTVVLLSSTISGWNYYQHKQEQERAERLQAEKLARLKASGFADRVWRETPSAEAMLRVCMNEIYQYPVTVVGWNITQISCDGKKVTASYKAGKKATSKQLMHFWEGQNIVFRKGMVAEISSKVNIKSSRKKEQLQPVTQIANEMLEKLQVGMAKGKMDDVLVDKKKVAKYEITSELSPASVMHFNNMDGVVIRIIKGQFTDQGVISWTISGEIYGK